ncbi:MAG: 16S rRNA (uracil(1498)-N(3))-methyltransferase [Nitrospinae bacterium]|nr:16S rRNA (uracil(1498)-N(3))-methyltransferase [Nitrospinota bacterium]
MNLILLFPEDFYSGREKVRLTGRRLRHVLEVHRAAVGDTLNVGLASGKMGTGAVTRLDLDALEMEVLLDHAPPPPLPVILLLSLPRPKVLKRVLLCAASMGVKRIFLINSWRVEKSFWKSPALEKEKVSEALALGLEQARDTILPQVMLRPLFKPFVEDELPDIVKDSISIVAHPGGAAIFPREVDRPVVLAVGPEGGFIPYELESFKRLGFQMAGLGERVLRVESAVPALLAKLF